MDKDVYVPFVKNGYMPTVNGAAPLVRGNGITTSGGDDAPAQDADALSTDRDNGEAVDEKVTN